MPPPGARGCEAKAQVPTAKAQVLGLPARLPMTKAQVLLPSADVLEALARVLTVQADGRAEQKLLKKAEINRKTRKIAKTAPLHPSAFPPKRQRRGIVVASKPPMAQAPFRSDYPGLNDAFKRQRAALADGKLSGRTATPSR
jgi:hypothetical protein